MTEKEYPGVLARVKAVMVDGILLLIFLVIASSIFSQLNDAPDYVRMLVFVLIFVLYDPILTSSTGGTIGHHIIGMTVRKVSDEKSNINFLMAIIRFIIKSSLGWASLFTVMANEKRRAIHDFVAQSVVTYK